MGESANMNKAALNTACPPMVGLGLERKVPAFPPLLSGPDRGPDTCSGRQSSLLNRMRAFGQLFFKLFNSC